MIFYMNISLLTEETESPAARVFDLVMAGLGLAVFLPFFAFVSISIYLDDGLPLLFRQPRLGRHRCLFELLKWRTMRNGRVTRVGAWLRRTGLDETAQFLNVLRGEMGMVGFRPLTPEDSARLGWDGPGRRHRWEAKPGITGLAQVQAGRSAVHSRRLEDVYLRRKSLWLDLKLILISFSMNLLGKRCVREALSRRWRRGLNGGS